MVASIGDHTERASRSKTRTCQYRFPQQAPDGADQCELIENGRPFSDEARDAAGLPSIMRSSYQLAVELPREANDSGSKSDASRDDSKRCTSALTEIFERLIRELVEPAGRDISLKLTIPNPCIKFREPRAKRYQIAWRQAANCFLDFANRGHVPIVTNQPSEFKGSFSRGISPGP